MEKFLTVLLFVCLFVACSDDDKRDDTILEMSILTGKNWYYNAWLGDENSFDSDDLLEVVRFEVGGTFKHIDFGGRNELAVGSWISDNESNRIDIRYNSGERATWHVQRSGNDYIQIIINEQGAREYLAELDYLEDLTTDAFLVNEYTDGNQFRTYIGADIRGNGDIREGKMITADGNVNLESHEFYWAVEKPVNIEFDGKEREVRFYLRIGSGDHLKLNDMIYTLNLPKRLPNDVDLNVNEENGEMKVSWKPYTSVGGMGVHYKVEILSENMDLKNPYFVSRIQNVGVSSLNIKSTTAGEIKNRINDLEVGAPYVVRLTALLYEPGVDAWNNGYASANVQAVSYFSVKSHKE